MNADTFRTLALGFPDAAEGAHHGHPDFRVRNKVFATLGPDGDWAMVKVTLDAQAALIELEPGVFEPMNGAWGRQGCTRVTLKKAKKKMVFVALEDAWRCTAPKSLLRQFDD